MKTKTNKMHWIHWTYITPLSFALSPIGTFIGVIAWGLDFGDACLLVAAQFFGFLFVFVISNGGE